MRVAELAGEGLDEIAIFSAFWAMPVSVQWQVAGNRIFARDCVSKLV